MVDLDSEADDLSSRDSQSSCRLAVQGVAVIFLPWICRICPMWNKIMPVLGVSGSPLKAMMRALCNQGKGNGSSSRRSAPAARRPVRGGGCGRCCSPCCTSRGNDWRRLLGRVEVAYPVPRVVSEGDPGGASGEEVLGDGIGVEHREDPEEGEDRGPEDARGSHTAAKVWCLVSPGRGVA